VPDVALPTHARAVIVGGGIIGCSIAYHLAKLGWKDVVVLEREQISCGTTWHAAGLITTLRDTESQTELAKYSLKLYQDLEQESGQATGFIQCGSIRRDAPGVRYGAYLWCGKPGDNAAGNSGDVATGKHG